MPTPAKPFTVLKNEKISHRTKSELLQRKVGEESLLSGKALVERPEIKSNKEAHKEFRRVNALLKSIDKNDAIYEPVINRYCLMQSECKDMEEKRERLYQIILNMDERFDEEIDSTPDEDKSKLIRLYAKSYNDSIKNILCIDSQVQQKRKMLLDIEKENCMTIAAALRNIPKKQEGKKNALLEALGGD